jgi:excisionase family DNA binding protein
MKINKISDGIPLKASGNTLTKGDSIFENGIESESVIAEDAWLDTAQAALFLKVSKKSLLNMTSNGEIPFSKLGRRNRYLKSDLHGLLLANRRGGFHGNQV